VDKEEYKHEFTFVEETEDTRGCKYFSEQRGRNHRITDVLDAMPKKHQAEARTLVCAMPYAKTQAACEALRAQFITRYHKVTPTAVER
jgi:putative transposase